MCDIRLIKGCTLLEDEDEQEQQTQNDLLNVLTHTTKVEAICGIIEGNASPVPRGMAAHVCKKLNYLKLHIQSTNRKQFHQLRFDNITRLCILQILLHAAISQNPTTHSQIPTTHLCRKTRYFRP